MHLDTPYSLENYCPVFFPDAEGNGRLQQVADAYNYTQCSIRYSLTFNVCFSWRSTRPEVIQGGGADGIGVNVGPNVSGGGSISGGSSPTGGPSPSSSPAIEPDQEQPIIARNTSALNGSSSMDHFHFNFDLVVLCHGTESQRITIQEEFEITSSLASFNQGCRNFQIEYPYCYNRGDCDLDDLCFRVENIEPINNDDINYIDTRHFSARGARLTAECKKNTDCFLDLKTLIPPTGVCADPRLFFMGYERNQEMIRQRLEKSQNDLDPCCGDALASDYNFTLTNFDADAGIFEMNPSDLIDANGTSLEQIINIGNHSNCLITYTIQHELCTGTKIFDQFEPYFSTISRDFNLYCGNDLIDSENVTFSFFHTQQGDVPCSSRTFQLEYLWDGSCPLDQISIFTTNTIVGPNYVFDSSIQTLESLTANVRCTD